MLNTVQKHIDERNGDLTKKRQSKTVQNYHNESKIFRKDVEGFFFQKQKHANRLCFKSARKTLTWQSNFMLFRSKQFQIHEKRPTTITAKKHTYTYKEIMTKDGQINERAVIEVSMFIALCKFVFSIIKQYSTASWCKV